jgi:hypothetical protein
VTIQATAFFLLGEGQTIDNTNMGTAKNSGDVSGVVVNRSPFAKKKESSWEVIELKNYSSHPPVIYTARSIFS